MARKHSTLRFCQIITQASLTLVLGWSLCVVYSEWYRNTVQIVFDSKNTEIWKIPFPAVTICPMRKIRLAYPFNLTASRQCVKTQIRLNTTCNLDDNDLSHLDAMSLVCSDERLQYDRDRELDDVFGTIWKAGSGPDDILDLCHVGKDRIDNCEGVYSEQMTPIGRCVTFNGLSYNETFRDGLHDDFAATAQHEHMQKNWNIDTGYTVLPEQDAESGTRPWRVMNHLRLKPNSFMTSIRQLTDGTEDGCQQDRGYMVTVRAPHEYWPTRQPHSQLVRIDGLTQIQITPHVVRSDPEEIRPYNAHIRRCYFHDERPLRFFKQYTKGNCDLECAANVTLSNCGCSAFFAPRDAQTRVCTIAHDSCVRKVYATLKRGTAGNEDKFLERCDCLAGCNEVEYRMEVDPNFVLSDKETGDDYAAIVVRFKRNEFRGKRRIVLERIFGLVAKCGGLMRLFLGVSLLGVAKKLYFMTMRVDCKQKKSRVE